MINGLLWFPGGNSWTRSRGPSWLTRQLVAALGSNLVQLNIGEDIISTGTLADSWPARVGTTLTNASAQKLTVASRSNRKGVKHIQTTTWGGLSANITSGRYVFAVLDLMPTPFGATYPAAVNQSTGNGNGTAIQGSASTSEWYTEAGFWSHKKNGVSTEDASGGAFAIIEATSSQTHAAGLIVGSDAYTTGMAGRNWTELIYCVGMCTTAPGNSDHITLLRKHYPAP